MAIFAVAPAQGQTAKSDEILAKYEACTAHGTGALLGNYTFEQRLKVCTAAIDSHDYQGEDLAAFHFNRALLLRSMGRMAEVQSDLRAAYAAWPEIMYTIILPVRDLMYQRRYDLAEAELDWLDKTVPANWMLPFYRAKIRLAQGQLDAAAKYADAAMLAQPGNATVLEFQGAIKATRGDVDGALATLDQLVAQYPDKATYYNSRCYLRALVDRDVAERALPDCDKAVSIAPQSTEIRDSRGLAYLRLGRFVESIADYNAAIALTDHPAAASFYGRALAEQGAGQKLSAEADIAAAESLSPGIGKKFNTLAMAAE